MVRLEIEAALARNIRVIPVLVDNTPMPGRQQLPDSLAALARRNALELSCNRYAYDIGRLLEAVEKAMGHDSTSTPAAASPSTPPATPASVAPGEPVPVSQQDRRDVPAGLLAITRRGWETGTVLTRAELLTAQGPH
jgi:hypothetical protein